MKPNLKVRTSVVLEDVGEDVYSYAVHVIDEDRPWLEVRLRVREWTDAGIVFFRLANVGIFSDDLTEAKPTVVLQDGEWWAAVLDAALEDVAFTSTSFDRAVERSPEVFTYLYGWEDGEVRESTIGPAEPKPRTGPAT